MAMTDVFRVYTYTGKLAQATVLQCVLSYIERYNQVPSQVKLHTDHEEQVKDFQIPVDGIVIIHDKWVSRNEIWVGPVPA